VSALKHGFFRAGFIGSHLVDQLLADGFDASTTSGFLRLPIYLCF